ncbi:MAG: hypothetical protein HY438_01730 [DPANN group archaeon]|nr:hypothetical protein [DPANN group archaeon]
MALVKISDELYKRAARAAKANPVEYPTIKNFVEKAVMDRLGNRRDMLSEVVKIVKRKKW